MPNTELLMQNLRRLSSPKVFWRSPKGDSLQRVDGHEHGGDKDHCGKATLITLPTELLAQILQHVPFKTLCAVKASCSAANEQISEGDIIRQWSKAKFHPRQTELYPQPDPATFLYVVEQERRAQIVQSSAVWYTNYIEHDIVRHMLRRRDTPLTEHQFHDSFRPVWEEIGMKLIPLLLTLQHYLDSFKDAILESCGTESPHQARTFRHQYATRRRAILAQYDPEHLLLLYKFWLFLSWVDNALLKRPSYVGTFERAVRGWSGEPLREYDTNVIMTLGHLTVRRQMMSLNSFKERRKLVDTCMRDLDPASSSSWREHWKRYGLRYGHCPTKQAAKAALKVKMQAGEIFADSARAILVEQGLLDADTDLEIGTSQQCSDFLTEIAGYDVMHVPPSRAPCRMLLWPSEYRLGR
ncbi:hypothetical protein LTR36_007702 [Oleoguttula mirabilis]|uniref:F-box domain-containing protein n=1 Tax=Oleoguttula mirabilis TaxID=1507867 RepID=A0AAV9JUJ5_9PEZI|nr:hypothetical protein LTR36_007702 [Oleoguttula mirabilis]